MERVNTVLGCFTLKLTLHCYGLYSPFTPAPAHLPCHLPLLLPLTTRLAGPDWGSQVCIEFVVIGVVARQVVGQEEGGAGE